MDGAEKLKQQGEIASEQGRQNEALVFLDRALTVAIGSKNFVAAINILGHHLHVYKALYQKTGQTGFMEMFYGDVLTGLHLADVYKITGQPKSVMLLRAGDYQMFKCRFKQAADCYRQACVELEKTGKQPPETHGEYLAHWAGALAELNKQKLAMAKFEQALLLIKSGRTLRKFHRQVIESGALLRRARAYASFGQKKAAKQDLLAAKTIADDLAKRHKMKSRQIQLRILAAKLNIKN